MLCRNPHVAALAAGLFAALTHPAAAVSYHFVNIANSSQSFDKTSFGGASINNSGTVVFKGGRDGVHGIYAGNGGPIATIADTTGPLSGVGYSASINDNGVVAFSAFLAAGGQGLFTSSGGTITPVIDSSGPFATFEPPAINNSGTLAFSASLDGGHAGIYVTDGGATTTIADLGGVGMQDFLGFDLGAFNNHGTAAFWAESTFGGPGGVGGSGIFSGNGGPVTTISYSGWGPSWFHPPSVNDSGTVAYVRHFAGGSTLYTFSGGITTPLVMSGDPGPFYDHLYSPCINAAGDVAFLGSVFQPIQGWGIYTGPDPTTDGVIRPGDALFGSTVTQVNLHRLNDHGDIVFWYELADGVVGIAVARNVTLPGDFNNDGIVDAADYVFWRDNINTPEAYDQWRASFGETLGSGAITATTVTAAVPEPSAIVLWLVIASALCMAGRFRSLWRISCGQHSRVISTRSPDFPDLLIRQYALLLLRVTNCGNSLWILPPLFLATQGHARRLPWLAPLSSEWNPHVRRSA